MPVEDPRYRALVRGDTINIISVTQDTPYILSYSFVSFQDQRIKKDLANVQIKKLRFSENVINDIDFSEFRNLPANIETIIFRTNAEKFDQAKREEILELGFKLEFLDREFSPQTERVATQTVQPNSPLLKWSQSVDELSLLGGDSPDSSRSGSQTPSHVSRVSSRSSNFREI